MNQRRKSKIRSQAERLELAAKLLQELSPLVLRYLSGATDPEEFKAILDHPDFRTQLGRWADLVEELQDSEPIPEKPWDRFQKATFSDDPEKHREIAEGMGTDEVWKNSRYQVNIRRHYPDAHDFPEPSSQMVVTLEHLAKCNGCGLAREDAAQVTQCRDAKRVMVSLSVKRLDKAPVHDWRDLQRIKNEIVGAEFEAVEMYPAESRLVDTSNQYWLWVMPPGFRFSFGYRERLVMEGDDFGVRQRPFDDPQVKAEAERNRQKLLRGDYDNQPGVRGMKERHSAKDPSGDI